MSQREEQINQKMCMGDSEAAQLVVQTATPASAVSAQQDVFEVDDVIMTDEACRNGKETIVEDSWDYNSQQQIQLTENAQDPM